MANESNGLYKPVLWERVVITAILVLFVLIGLIVFASVARADVALTILTQPAREVPCPETRPITIRNLDGTYTRQQPTVIRQPQTCFLPPKYSLEVWSDYPERGGRYVRTIEQQK